MKETDFYPEICDKFSRYLVSYLPQQSNIYFSYDKPFDQMVNGIEEKAGISELSKTYLPKLKLDILFGIKLPQLTTIQYILLEVKYLDRLGLSEFSQLMGYLQVAKKIRLGVLFLVMKPESQVPLSRDFNEIMRTNNLSLDWKMLIDLIGQETHSFKVGLSYYIPKNGIEWIDTNTVGGFSSFPDLARELTSKS